ncbi:PqqD family protein [Aquabacter cavernae]|uniref:PqqD family protein n=1 Tax=Aquabacter cavernae TaxID=2496029 RepID=UPI000F8F1585|nr:PqqD family protein [Aquabacter cavernae]
MQPGMRIAAAAALLSAEVGGEAVVMDPRTGRYYSFEGVGSDIWRRLTAPVSAAALCDDLVRDYDGPPEEIRATTLAFLDEMLEMHLIVPA